MRAITFFFTVLLAAVLWMTPVFSQGVEQDQAIMHVVVVNPTQTVFYRRGTAFHVGDGVFYTNAHVVKTPVPEGYTEWYLASTSATRSTESWVGPVSITCVHPLWRGANEGTRAFPYDIARLKAPAVPTSALLLHDRPPQVGQPVTIRGFPLASRAWPPIMYTATGRVADIRGQEHTFRIRIESGFSLGGSSGSPVLTSDGQVLGVAFAGVGVENRTTSELASAIFASAAVEGCPR